MRIAGTLGHVCFFVRHQIQIGYKGSKNSKVKQKAIMPGLLGGNRNRIRVTTIPPIARVMPIAKCFGGSAMPDSLRSGLTVRQVLVVIRLNSFFLLLRLILDEQSSRIVGYRAWLILRNIW